MTETPATLSPVGRKLLLAAFFISGFVALLYQLVWQRALFAIYGSNTESVSVVVAAFMLGLGAGSLGGGVVSAKVKYPLRSFAVIELLIGLYGVISMGLFEWVGQNTLGASVGLTGILAFLLVVIPTGLMGATLPVLVRFLAQRELVVGQVVGDLYGINTFGAAASSLLAVSVILGAFGISGTIILAAVLNIVVAVGAGVIHARVERVPA